MTTNKLYFHINDSIDSSSPDTEEFVEVLLFVRATGLEVNGPNSVIVSMYLFPWCNAGEIGPMKSIPM